MAAKRENTQKAKEKRQKIIAAAGGVILLGLLAIQGPRTWKMIHPSVPPEPVAAPAPAVPVAADPSLLPTPGTVAGAAPAPAGGSGEIADSDPPPLAAVGQLVSFSRFSSKDPFAQQIDEEAAAQVSAPKAGGESKAGGDGLVGSEAEPGSPAPAAPAAPATSAVIAVNGVEETVQVKDAFPKDQPVFRLVSLTRTEAKIGIAGGALASGQRTVSVKKGKTLTLVNTADGTRYELKLVAIG